LLDGDAGGLLLNRVEEGGPPRIQQTAAYPLGLEGQDALLEIAAHAARLPPISPVRMLNGVSRRANVRRVIVSTRKGLRVRIKSMLTASVCAVAIVGAGAGSAFAGESTGSGKYTPIENDIAASICSFSGQNPEGLLPVTDPNYEPGRTQSWGQIVAAGAISPSQLKGGDPMPGTSCNGHTGYFAGGGSEG
jgi:hypothetical protein